MIQCGAAITWSGFFQILTIGTGHLRGSIVKANSRFMFCLCYYSAVYNNVLYKTALLRHRLHCLIDWWLIYAFIHSLMCTTPLVNIKCICNYSVPCTVTDDFHDKEWNRWHDLEIYKGDSGDTLSLPVHVVCISGLLISSDHWTVVNVWPRGLLYCMQWAH